MGQTLLCYVLEAPVTAHGLHGFGECLANGVSSRPISSTRGETRSGHALGASLSAWRLGGPETFAH